MRAGSSERGAIGRRQLFKALGLGAFTASVAGCLGDARDDAGSESGTWDIGTPGEGSINHVVAQGYARVLSDNSEELEVNIRNFSGSEESLRILGRGDVELATSANIIGYAAYNSEQPVESMDFTGDRSVDVRPLQAFTHADLRYWWVTLDDDIETLDDLRGKRVNLGTSGTTYMMSGILQEAGILEDVDGMTTEFQDIPFALQEGRVDAIPVYAVGGTVAPGWHAPLEGEDVNIIEYTDDHLSTFEESDYFLVSPGHPNEIYETDVPEEVQCPTALFQTMISEDADDEFAYEFASQVLGHSEDVQEFHAALQSFSPEFATRLASGVPVHPGIAEYYRDNDLWKDEFTTP